MNYDIPDPGGSTGGGGIGSAVNRDIQNLSTNKLAKAKKPNLAKFKKSKLVEAKKLDFAIA